MNDNIVLDFGNIVSELETKNLQLLKIKDNNGLFVVDNEGNLYGIETYYAGGYLDRFIGEKFIISFDRMEQPTRDFEDWRKEFMDASWVKSFIERIVKKEYPNFQESSVEDDQIPACRFNIRDKVKIPYISINFRGYQSADDVEYSQYPHDFGNGFKIQTFYGILLPEEWVSAIGDEFDIREEAEEEYPDHEIVVGFRVVCENEKDEVLLKNCDSFCKTVEDAISLYKEKVLPLIVKKLPLSEQIQCASSRVDKDHSSYKTSVKTFTPER